MNALPQHPPAVRSTNEAVAFVADLKKTGRYQQDVY
jgi:sulfite reductase alpha subunit-like flavoprotein